MVSSLGCACIQRQCDYRQEYKVKKDESKVESFVFFFDDSVGIEICQRVLSY